MGRGWQRHCLHAGPKRLLGRGHLWCWRASLLLTRLWWQSYLLLIQWRWRWRRRLLLDRWCSQLCCPIIPLGWH